MVRFIEKIDLGHVDFSFIPSLQCDLECTFCMYGGGPVNKLELNLDHARQFLATIDWNRISSWGFYGGEISIALPLYQTFMDLIPPEIQKFTITNGSWTANPRLMDDFLSFSAKNHLRIIVSGTEEHKRYQNKEVIQFLDGVSGIHFKGDDDIHPMGRAAKSPWICTQKCLTHPQPTRLAMFPGGHIILQNCDGAYPVIGSYRDAFNDVFARSFAMRQNGCLTGTLNINDILCAEG